MNSIKETKYIGKFEVDDDLVEAVRAFQVWDGQRNQLYGLSDTRSILFLYNREFPEGVVPKTTKGTEMLFQRFLPVVRFVQDQLRKDYGQSYCSRALLTSLPAGGKIEDHIDPGWLFSLTKRFHWTLQTHVKSTMYVQGTAYHFAKGAIWEINNKLMHSARNDSSEDRLHFIFDLFMVDSSLGRTPLPFEKGSFDEKLFRVVQKRKAKSGRFEV